MELNDEGPPFYDVNGNRVITAGDALTVIVGLTNLAITGAGEGEQVAPLAPPAGGKPDDGGLNAQLVNDLGGADAGSDKIVDVPSVDPISDDLVALIAAEQDSDDDDDDALAAVDAAMADLL